MRFLHFIGLVLICISNHAMTSQSNGNGASGQPIPNKFLHVWNKIKDTFKSNPKAVVTGALGTTTYLASQLPQNKPIVDHEESMGDNKIVINPKDDLRPMPPMPTVVPPYMDQVPRPNNLVINSLEPSNGHPQEESWGHQTIINPLLAGFNREEVVLTMDPYGKAMKNYHKAKPKIKQKPMDANDQIMTSFVQEIQTNRSITQFHSPNQIPHINKNNSSAPSKVNHGIDQNLVPSTMGPLVSTLPKPGTNNQFHGNPEPSITSAIETPLTQRNHGKTINNGHHINSVDSTHRSQFTDNIIPPINDEFPLQVEPMANEAIQSNGDGQENRSLINSSRHQKIEIQPPSKPSTSQSIINEEELHKDQAPSKWDNNNQQHEYPPLIGSMDCVNPLDFPIVNNEGHNDKIHDPNPSIKDPLVDHLKKENNYFNGNGNKVQNILSDNTPLTTPSINSNHEIVNDAHENPLILSMDNNDVIDFDDKPHILIEEPPMDPMATPIKPMDPLVYLLENEEFKEEPRYDGNDYDGYPLNNYNKNYNKSTKYLQDRVDQQNLPMLYQPPGTGIIEDDKNYEDYNFECDNLVDDNAAYDDSSVGWYQRPKRGTQPLNLPPIKPLKDCLCLDSPTHISPKVSSKPKKKPKKNPVKEKVTVIYTPAPTTNGYKAHQVQQGATSYGRIRARIQANKEKNHIISTPSPRRERTSKSPKIVKLFEQAQQNYIQPRGHNKKYQKKTTEINVGAIASVVF